MASLQLKGETWYCQFMFKRERHTFRVGKVEECEAHAVAAKVDYWLMRIKQNLVHIPPGCTLLDFVRFDGKPPDQPPPPEKKPFALANLRDEYITLHLHTYCRGLLSDLKRKSVEPIALASGCAVRTLQEFLRDHQWRHAQTVATRPDPRQLQRDVGAESAGLPDDGLGNVGLIDETSAVKSGARTPGVQRQYLGCVGKIDNGVVTVHRGVCKGRYKTLIDAELFLPEDWAKDRERCQAAGIPDDMEYRPKSQIALEELDRAKANQVHLDWITFDEGYGKAPEFICGLDERQLLFAGEVPKGLSCLAVNGSGQRPDAQVKGQRAEDVARQSPAFLKQPWVKIKLSRQTVGAQVWEVKAARVWQMRDKKWSNRTYWLIWARNVSTGEEKHFLSNASADAKLQTLVRVAFRRWNVEPRLPGE